MAANDYIVIAPNRRGLPGFGMEWLEEISGDYSGLCMQDYLSAVDDICKEPYVDKEHIGAVGASFGGYSIYWLAGNHNKRFKAFIAHDGIFNTQQQYVETEELWFPNWDMGSAPWKKNEDGQTQKVLPLHHIYMLTNGTRQYFVFTDKKISALNIHKQSLPSLLHACVA